MIISTLLSIREQKEHFLVGNYQNSWELARFLIGPMNFF